MLLAVTGYLLLIDVCLTVEIKEENVVITGVRALTQQILILLSNDKMYAAGIPQKQNIVRE